MSVVEEFENIIARNVTKGQLIEFFKANNQRKDVNLLPIIKDLLKRVGDILINEGYKETLADSEILISSTFRKEMEETVRDINDPIIKPDKVWEQRELLYLSEYFSTEDKETEFLRSSILEIIEKSNITSWYFPKWLCKKDNYYLWNSYMIQLHCIKTGKNTISNGDIAHRLSQTKFNSINDIPAKTINEHIWYLFEYESLIHNQYDGKGDYWIHTLKDLAESKIIDRKRVLKEALLTTSRFTNRAIVGYFFKMLESLEPTDNELLELQDNLLLVLQSQHSKPINQTLKYFKRIHKEPKFDIEGFMEQVPLLLTWDVKAVVNSTLSLIDALIKAYPTHKDELALLVVQTLGQEDESLQIKAVKLLAKHKLLENPTILREIDIYADGLYHSTKKLLPNLKEKCTEEENIEIVPPAYIQEDNRILYPESLGDMVFFLSSILDKSSPYEYELFTELLPQIDKHLDAGNAQLIAPAIQRAYKYYIKWGTSETIYSYLHFTVANALMHYGWLLIKRVSDNFSNIEVSDKLNKLFFNNFNTPKGAEFSTIVKKEYKESKQDVKAFHKLLLSLQAYTGSSIEPIDFGDFKKDASPLYILKLRLQGVFEAIKNQTEVQLSLSMPTHTPCSIEPKIFIERIASCDKPSDLQMQVALLRLELVGLEKHIKSLNSSEIKSLLGYLVEKEKFSLDDMKHPSWWLIAILRKRDAIALSLFTQHYKISYDSLESVLGTSFEVKQDPWEYETWEKGKKVTITQISKKIQFKQSYFFLNLPFETLFKQIYIQNQNGELPLLDTTYGLSLLPTLPETYLSRLTEKAASHWDSAQLVRTLENLMLYLIEIWRDFQPSVYLFVAYMAIYESKTLRNLSAELWIKATNEGNMNQQLLGQTLGKLEHNEYAPLKRFTDLIVANMLNISTLHNKGLHTLLSNMITHMNDEPIKGTKKLLEIYLEVLSVTGLEVPYETMQKLRVWGEVKSLKSVLKKID